MEKVVAIIQARMGSTRLPGKVKLPLGEKHALERVVERVEKAENVDEVVVATSSEKQDDIIERILGSKSKVHRGSEENVLERMFEAAEKNGADIIVRITGDCPLISPKVVDKTIEKLQGEKSDYSTNIIERTFPRGFDVEAFTFSSFETVKDEADELHHREHVTPYYRENSEKFKISGVTSDEVFEDENLVDRSDLRLTLDEADDYMLLKKLFEELEDYQLQDEKEIIDHIDENNLSEINSHIEQKEVKDEDSNKS